MDPFNVGYACINTELRKQRIFCSRTCRIATARTKGTDYLRELGKQNVADLKRIIEWNCENQIRLFRISSDLFPYAGHSELGYSIDYCQEALEECGQMAKNFGMRLTFHPGQYTQLSTEKEQVLKNSVLDLQMHADIADCMKLDHDSVIVLHGGGKSQGKEKALQRLEQNYLALAENIRSRLVLENCEINYSIRDLLPLCQKLGIPLVVDYHHHALNSNGEQVWSLIPEVLPIWHKRGIRPKFHLSESRNPEGNLMERRAHSDLITNSLNILKKHPKQVDLMIEAKLKEQALFYLRENQFKEIE